ncbi:tyrosine-type recombinase/integrase [Pseudomonas sp. B14(2017)]|uniref:tyrosine-type recombinase/integrase n=1 Tax=Pseudomonas sp. B14(2017) TaxID=1981745 RepID=UPI00130272C1|nr:tyrosine-type recombinase/integrase [Pseudomonas sp. B14(2017)]
MTISLKTRSRETAMRYSRRIEAALKVFHLERPEDTWSQLVVPLRNLAESLLWELVQSDDRVALSLEYSELLEDLQAIQGGSPMTVDRVKAINTGVRIVKAAQERLHKGDPTPLSTIIEELQGQEDTVVPEAPVVDPECVTLSRLGAEYLEEQQDSLAPASVRDMKSAIKTLAEALTVDGSEINLKTHTRQDMVRLKANLMEGRKPLTVNKLLTRLGTLLSWAENNGYIEKSFNKGLKIAKGAESGRKAFTEAQTRDLMKAMGELPVTSWKRWAMSLGAITGARIGEIYQLNKEDVRKVGNEWVIDLNTNHGKTLKNKHSERVVPLVDGAYGFDLQGFLEYVNGVEGDKLFDRVAHNFTRVLNETLRDVLQHDSGEGLTYHSLRHTLAGVMKQQGIQVSTVQAILGHSSQTITFDLYGGDARLAVGKLADALRESLMV